MFIIIIIVVVIVNIIGSTVYRKIIEINIILGGSI
jgi:hypothetical protein